MIAFNRPSLAGRELEYVAEAVRRGRTCGNGPFTARCRRWFERKYYPARCLLTTSCTDALEMAAILARVKPGDEVIVPSYTFVSTALAFVRQGAKVVFADSGSQSPHVDVAQLESLISSRTKAIVPVHYAGIACDMGRILGLAAKHDLLVIGDSAQAIGSYYAGDLSEAGLPWLRQVRRTGKAYPLECLGHLSCLSFHETKNIQCGEGGLLTVNDSRLIPRAEVIWEKGTNRVRFERGELCRYKWVDIGSSFLPSGITAAFLLAQIEGFGRIQAWRKRLWDLYFEGLKPLASLGCFEVPYVPPYAVGNAHMFYIVCRSGRERTRLLAYLAAKGIRAATHYQSLHDSPYYRAKYEGADLVNCRRYVACLLRLPLYNELQPDAVEKVIGAVWKFYRG